MDLSLIKQRMSCEDYLSSRGISVPRSKRTVSPLRQGASNPTSFLVSDDHWYDFGSGNGGDVIDLCAQLEFDGDVGAAIRALSGRLGLENNHPRSSAWQDAIQALCNRTEFYHQHLTVSDREYLHKRGFTDETINDVKIGRVTDGYLRGRLFLPYFKNNYVCYYATRAMPGSTNPDSKYMKAALKESPYYENIPWGLPTLKRLNEPTNPAPGSFIISEGYFDALSWYQDGYAVLSAITGRFSHDQLTTVLSACRSAKNVIIIYDNDPISHAGAGFTASMAGFLFEHKIPFRVGYTPPSIKDVNDYYASGLKLSDLVSSSRDGLSYLAESMTDVDAFETFIGKIKRTASAASIKDIIDKSKFPDSVKRELNKYATSVPLESFIADEVRSSHNLVYVENVGFYEWTGKIWERKTDFDIQAYASSAYGKRFATQQRTTNVARFLRSITKIDTRFDSRNIITFQNGTLEIDTGIFRDFSPADYASIIMDYNYDPSALCPRWEAFIEDVTNGIPQRQEILQEIAGYVLFPSCKYQKIFVLTGDGGNGKSVYLEVLQKLFGDANTTHVEPTGLAQDFQRIRIKDSLLNIGSDINSDFTRGEIREWLLKIADGTSIQACYKGLNYIDFVPRCKLIYACNTLPKASVIAGLNRRMLFVEFELQYVDDPILPNQRKRDTDMIPKLLDELPGIFLWAYHGYTTLNSVGYFTEGPEQSKFLREFEESSDPVILFVSESEYSGEVWRSTIYDDYKAWCSAEGHLPLASNRFFAHFRNAMGERIIQEGQKRVDSQRIRYFDIKPAEEEQTIVPVINL